ncbi:uncharacterized protein METZ01_LOCUS82300 [marine metagenome]|uniref:Uncharacterized protein n=1 Tax=marine metagenome TaxID=408172 RepID=A0A381UMS1_9ZZZZ
MVLVYVIYINIRPIEESQMIFMSQ